MAQSVWETCRDGGTEARRGTRVRAGEVLGLQIRKIDGGGDGIRVRESYKGGGGRGRGCIYVCIHFNIQ